jgi:hypothetical protein
MTATLRSLLAGWVATALLATVGSATAHAEKTPQLSKPTLEAHGGDLLAFVRATEDYCGVGRGAALVAKNRRTIYLQLPEPGHMTGDRFHCLTQTLDAPHLNRQGIRVLLVTRAAR